MGIELELALVDAATFELTSAAPAILSHVPQRWSRFVKPELMQCYLEINTAVCRTVDEAHADLAEKLVALETIADQEGVLYYWSGAHPFSRWEEQRATEDERYARLLELLEDMGRRLVTFGLHVHVGVDSGDKAVMICDRIMRHLPVLLALSCNSPWWNGRVSGLASHRSKIMEGLPTAGLPPLMRNWSEFVWLVNHLQQTGFINSIRDIWWMVRPHHNFGTVEVRVCDMPGRLEDVSALAALIQCLVAALSEEIDLGTYQHDCHPMMVRQNIWRAERFGLDTEFVDAFTHDTLPARQLGRNLCDRLEGTAKKLRCANWLARASDLFSEPTWAERQLEMLREAGGDLRAVVREMTALSRMSPAPEVSLGTRGSAASGRRSDQRPA